LVCVETFLLTMAGLDPAMVNGVRRETQTKPELTLQNLFALKENIVRCVAVPTLSNSTHEILRANRAVL
jgi:hypothetical protein